MATIWRLPAQFVCEIYGYGEFTAIEDVTTGGDPNKRGTVLDIPSEAVDAPVIRIGGADVPMPFSKPLKPPVLLDAPGLARDVAAPVRRR